MTYKMYDIQNMYDKQNVRHTKLYDIQNMYDKQNVRHIKHVRHTKCTTYKNVRHSKIYDIHVQIYI